MAMKVLHRFSLCTSCTHFWNKRPSSQSLIFKLDYYSVVQMGLSLKITQKLQPEITPRMFRASSDEHALLCELHWLPFGFEGTSRCWLWFIKSYIAIGPTIWGTICLYLLQHICSSLLQVLSIKWGLPNPRAVAHYRAVACFKPGCVSDGQACEWNSICASSEQAHEWEAPLRQVVAPWACSQNSIWMELSTQALFAHTCKHKHPQLTRVEFWAQVSSTHVQSSICVSGGCMHPSSYQWSCVLMYAPTTHTHRHVPGRQGGKIGNHWIKWCSLMGCRKWTFPSPTFWNSISSRILLVFYTMLYIVFKFMKLPGLFGIGQPRNLTNKWILHLTLDKKQ